jgi:hypothetical protein
MTNAIVACISFWYTEIEIGLFVIIVNIIYVHKCIDATTGGAAERRSIVICGKYQYYIQILICILSSFFFSKTFFRKVKKRAGKEKEK